VLRPEHAIYGRPFPAEFKAEATAPPENFKKWKPGLGATIPTFPIFVKLDGVESEPGLVTSDFGFEETPDAEAILGGVNMKGPDYPAVARHGSFVQWGFHCLPRQLTPEGRRLFLNAVAYAHAHRGVKVETLRLRPARRELADTLFIFLPMYKEAERTKVLARHFAGEPIPEALLTDKAAARKWLDEREPYFRPVNDGSDWNTAYQLTVDAECRELGISNGAPAFLEALAARLTKDPKDRLAGSLAARYVPDVEPAGLPAWLEKNRAQVYFTETGGWVWRVKGEAARGLALRLAGAADPKDPVAVKVEATTTMLTLTFKIADGWHVSSPKAKEAEPVKIRFRPGSAFEAAGEPDFDDDDKGEMRGWGEVKVPLRRSGKGNALEIEVEYTACDPKTCRPPKILTFRR
jgi:hypothetical protein